MVSIVIPITSVLGDQNKQDLDNLLQDIQPLKDEFTCIVGCFDSTDFMFNQYFKEKYPWLVGIHNDGKAFNFTKNANLGLRYVTQKHKDDIILINQDCRVNPKALLNLPGKGIASARSVDTLDLKDQPLVREELKDSHFAFYCVAFSKEVIEKVGFLDESFIKTYSDTDYCLRTLLAGVPVEVTNIEVYHRGSHIDTSDPDWVSGSGTYNQQDLNLSCMQYLSKWQFNGRDVDVIPHVLENYVWEDRFKEN